MNTFFDFWNVTESVKMPKSYSEELRWRAVWKAVVREMSVHSTRSVAPKQHAGGVSKSEWL